MPLGLYVSVPFCRTKCTYCNFASDVFSRAVFERYIDRVIQDMAGARATAEQLGAQFDATVDSIYLGGGTPSVLASSEIERLFVTISQNFEILPDAEITVECAPGTLPPPLVEALCRQGVNRVSMGVQSFTDAESASVGRQHKRTTVMEDIARLRAAGISNINVDLIAGLPHQTPASWEFSLDEMLASSAPHASVYMLEVDEDSRLGRELIAGGARYHAHFVPDEDLVADLYESACDRLNAGGLAQYEISNFARAGFESCHNLKYWTRQPYWGFGVDAHSMLPAVEAGAGVRFSTADSLDEFLAGQPLKISPVSRRAAIEEAFFLGLRLNRGVNLREIEAEFGPLAAGFSELIGELKDGGMIEQEEDVIRLTARGRLLSNEVFERFLSAPESVGQGLDL